MYDNIKKATIAENAKGLANMCTYIDQGHINTENPQYSEPDAGIRRESTDRRWEQYQAKEITREKAIELAKARVAKQYAVELEKDMRRTHQIENAGTLTSATITIEWKRSAMWGSNPTAELRYSYIDNDGKHCYSRIEGSSVGGCGYDKESTAAAQVLNDCPAALKPLYDAVDANPDKSLESVLGYGSGYGERPSFHGGVGVNCFRSIYERVGYKWENVSSGKAFDVYTITRIEQ